MTKGAIIMRKMTCPCEQIFSVDFPEIIDLDSMPEVIGNIKNGSFLTCICPSCNAELRTEFATKFEWKSKKINLQLIPEIERLSFLGGKTDGEPDVQTVIGFAELCDRVSVLEKNLNPLTIEAIKYHLITKAQETHSNSKILIFFESQNEKNFLEFHIHGLRANEVAVTHIPMQLYDTIQKDAQYPDKEPFSSLVNGSYISVQNILFEETQNV